MNSFSFQVREVSTYVDDCDVSQLACIGTEVQTALPRLGANIFYSMAAGNLK